MTHRLVSSTVTSLAVTAIASQRWRHGRGFGLRTAGPVFTFQADTPVSEGHQVNKDKVTGLVTSTFSATPGRRDVPSTRNVIAMFYAAQRSRMMFLFPRKEAPRHHPRGVLDHFACIALFALP